MSNLRPRFFHQNNSDFIEIAIVGDPNVWVGKVKPEHTVQYPREWAAYAEGRKDAGPSGTSLMELPGFTDSLQSAYIAKGVRNIEEMAAITDVAASKLGLGALTWREKAKVWLHAQKERRTNELMMAANATPMTVRETPPDMDRPSRPRRKAEDEAA